MNGMCVCGHEHYGWNACGEGNCLCTVFRPQLSGLEKLKQLNRKLTELLAAWNPGLMSWRTELHRTLLELAQYSGDANTIAAAEEASDALQCR